MTSRTFTLLLAAMLFACLSVSHPESASGVRDAVAKIVADADMLLWHKSIEDNNASFFRYSRLNTLAH